ncbi:Uncharacterised protein [[Actinobacillus] rossii]|uniref:Uncharacterized protein n=1 Tax=[Actinobacillus] rossii TaxID=123820 RepID=A0A380TTG0_9PAST|nr:Uncharacterised protein [[Actinobacillus] rossii]
MAGGAVVIIDIVGSENFMIKSERDARFFIVLL